MDRPAHYASLHGDYVDVSAPALVQAAAVACAYLENTRQATKNQSFQVLAELARRTKERAAQGKTVRFLASNLKEGVAPGASKDASGWLSPLWNRLIELEPQWEEGLLETARTLDLAYIPKLSKDPGSPAEYSLRALAVPAEAAATPKAKVPDGGLHYTPESVTAPAGWLNSTLSSGIVRWTVGLRWTIVLGIVILSFGALATLWLTVTIGLRVTRPLSLADLLGTLSALGIAAAVLPIYRFLAELFDLRIVMAPSILTPMSKDNITLEVRRRDANDDVGELAFVRYTSICPKCDGTVVVDSGRKEFPDRLVGRCRRSGREHVFSFDHVLRVGQPLR